MEFVYQGIDAWENKMPYMGTSHSASPEDVCEDAWFPAVLPSEFAVGL